LQEVRHFYFDLTGCKYLGTIHKRIREAFNFPEWYGENWDAFWDLYGYYTHDEMLVHVRGLETLPKEFDEDVASLIEILKRAESKMPNMKWVIEN